MNFSRGSLILDCLRKFVVKDAQNVDQELTRMYNFIIPLNTSFEEVYSVLTELIADVKKMEEAEAARQAQAQVPGEQVPAEQVPAADKPVDPVN
jgi:hypothetical protein